MTRHAGRGNFPLCLDPRCALACAFILSVAVACLQSQIAAATALLLSIFMLFCARKNQGIWRQLFYANIFIAFIWLVVPWSTAGEAIWRAGWLELSANGLNLALLVTLKANAIICIFLALAAPLSITAWGNALRSMKCPEKLIWLFLLMGRNIFIIQDEWRSMYAAARLRGYLPGSSPKSWRVTGSMLAFLLIRASDRGERMREAMLLRGFNGRLPFAGNLRTGPADLFFAIFAAAILVLLIYMEFFCAAKFRFW